MYSVILCGNRHTDALWEFFYNCKDISLQSALPGSTLTGDIALYAHPQARPALHLRCRVGIAPADAPAALRFFKTQKIPVLTVGRAGRDTLTLSSRQETSAVISLQREIRTLNGNLVGPADYPITFTEPCSDTALLYTAALLLLCGKEAQLLQGHLFPQSAHTTGRCRSLSGGSN